jgi:glycosyltransferase involved in cell wall biosynthesis
MLFSIIIPVYNTKPEFILETLNSLKKIKLSKALYEVIIVNDGSDNIDTLSFLENHNFTSEIVLHKINKGLSSARNYGISKAIGKYIYPLDSDDVLHDDFNLFIKELENDDFDVLYGNLMFFGDMNKFHEIPKFNRLRLFYDQNMIPACSFFKKELWGKVNGYDESFETIEDWDFWVRCAIHNAKFKKLEKCAYNYRVILDGNSLSQTKSHLNSFFIEKMRVKIPALKLSKNELHNFVEEYINGENFTREIKEKENQYIKKLEKKINNLNEIISSNNKTIDSNSEDIRVNREILKKIRSTFFYKTFVKLELSLKSKLKK